MTTTSLKNAFYAFFVYHSFLRPVVSDRLNSGYNSKLWVLDPEVKNLCVNWELSNTFWLFIDKVLSKCKVCEKCLFDLGHLVVVFLDAIIVFKVILRLGLIQPYCPLHHWILPKGLGASLGVNFLWALQFLWSIDRYIYAAKLMVGHFWTLLQYFS